MFDPYVVKEGERVQTAGLTAFQIEDAKRKLGRRNLTLRQEDGASATVVKK